nr:RecName: Full=Unknown protein from spot 32 of 2D-PAGE of etiolated coleoptile [Zea mays]
ALSVPVFAVAPLNKK